MIDVKWAANQRMESVHTDNGVTFYVRTHGDIPQLAGAIDMHHVSPEVCDYAARDGLKKRVNDACAGAKTNEGRFEIVKRLCDHYNSGSPTWTVHATVRALNRAAMFAAIATVRELNAAHVEFRLRNKTDDELRAYNAVPKIAAEYVRLTVEARGATVDEEALFADL